MGVRIARFALGPWPFFPGVVIVIAFVTLVVRAFGRAAALSTDASSTFSVLAPNLATAAVASALIGGLVWAVPRIVARVIPRDGRVRYLLTCLVLAVIIAVALHLITRFVFTDGAADEQATLLVSLGFSTPFTFISELLVFGLIGTIDARLRRGERALTERLGVVELQRAAVLSADERVRAEIAATLHDDIQTRLLRVAMLLGSVRGELAPAPRAVVDDAIAELEDTREHGVRAIGRRLAPNLDAVGLITSLREFTDAYAGAMAVDVRCDEAVVERFGASGGHRPEALAIYRIAEQALQNALKHGRATRAVVGLHTTGPLAVELEVVADGAAPPAQPQPGEGTRLIEAWLAEVGGTWSLAATPGGGSRFAATIGG